MTKTIKTEFPPIRMRPVGGKLEPVSQFDEERVETFSKNRDVQVYVVQEPHAKLIRKWWAVINNTLKHCDTRWTNSVACSSAVKLALGKISPFKTMGGKWGLAPISLNEMDDDELSETFEGMVSILSEETGVDVLTLKSEAADVGADPEPETKPETDEGILRDPEPVGDVEKQPEPEQKSADVEKKPPAIEGDKEPTPKDAIVYARYLCVMLQTFIDDETITDQEGCLGQVSKAWSGANDSASGGIFCRASEDLIQKGKSITGWAEMVIKKEVGITRYKTRVAELLNCMTSELEKKEAA